MIKTTERNEPNLMGFRVEGGIEKSDIEQMSALFEERTDAGQPLRFYLDATDLHLDEISGKAIWEDMMSGLRHPKMVANMEKFALISDENWLRRGFEADCALFPGLTGKAFAPGEVEAAKRWLRVDEPLEPQVQISWLELAGLTTIKSVSGIAIGLLLADYLNRQTRRQIGWAALAGAFIVGLPQGLRLLKGKRAAK